ncbi:MAG: metallophosphoesterase [Phycisphaerales bacterium]
MPRWLPPIRVPDSLWRMLVLRGDRSPIETTRHEFPIRDLPSPLHAFRALFITDIHCGPLVPDDYLRAVFQHAASLKPDVYFLGGDYIDRKPVEFDRFCDLAAPILQQSTPVLGVLGNHDWWPHAKNNGHPHPHPHAGADRLRSAGIRMIDNSRLFLQPDRRWTNEAADTSLLCVAGFGDILEDRIDLDAALGDIPAHIPRIVLSHNPDAAALPAIHTREHRIDLMLCGHTHGGQCVLPLIGPPMLLIRNRRYGRGLCQGPGFPILTSRGVGVTSLPIRLNCPPQIHELTFLSETPRNTAIRP